MNLPVLSSEGNLAVYLQEIKKFPMLTAEEEYMLAKRYKEHGDSDAAHKLVTSHLRLVAKIAMGYRGYGLPVTDLISDCLLYTSPSPRDALTSRMPSSA